MSIKTWWKALWAPPPRALVDVRRIRVEFTFCNGETHEREFVGHTQWFTLTESPITRDAFDVLAELLETYKFLDIGGTRYAVHAIVSWVIVSDKPYMMVPK